MPSQTSSLIDPPRRDLHPQLSRIALRQVVKSCAADAAKHFESCFSSPAFSRWTNTGGSMPELNLAAAVKAAFEVSVGAEQAARARVDAVDFLNESRIACSSLRSPWMMELSWRVCERRDSGTIQHQRQGWLRSPFHHWPSFSASSRQSTAGKTRPYLCSAGELPSRRRRPETCSANGAPEVVLQPSLTRAQRSRAATGSRCVAHGLDSHSRGLDETDGGGIFRRVGVHAAHDNGRRVTLVDEGEVSARRKAQNRRVFVCPRTPAEERRLPLSFASGESETGAGARQ